MSSLHVEGVAEGDIPLQPRGLGSSPDQSPRFLTGPSQPPHEAASASEASASASSDTGPSLLIALGSEGAGAGATGSFIVWDREHDGVSGNFFCFGPWCPVTTATCLCKLAIAVKSQRCENPKGSAELGTSTLPHHKRVLHSLVAGM